MPGGPRLAIGEIARRSGVPATTLRYYEQVGVLRPPERVSGRRAYDEQVLDELRVVDVAQRAGFSLAETATLLEGVRGGRPPSEAWRELARAKLPEIVALVTRAQAMQALLEHGMRCTCTSLDDCPLRTTADPLRC